MDGIGVRQSWHRRRLRGDANQYVSHDFRGEARLPKLQQLGVRQAAQRTVERIVHDNVLVIDINENRVMAACRHILLEAMAQDRANAGVAT